MMLVAAYVPCLFLAEYDLYTAMMQLRDDKSRGIFESCPEPGIYVIGNPSPILLLLMP